MTCLIRAPNGPNGLRTPVGPGPEAGLLPGGEGGGSGGDGPTGGSTNKFVSDAVA